MAIRVRFAPSPTGHLHVGGARTAIFNWLFARHHGGSFLIRVEDTDQARSTLESEQMVIEDLRWLGLHWEEGPDVGGPHTPYRQSERTELYKRMANELVERGRVYRCFCTEEELERKRQEAEAQARPPHYDLTCYRLNPEEVRSRVERGMPFALRFHVPEDGDVTIQDLIRGEVTWRKESLGDFIILRSDGMPTYNFCVVVDDHDMEITHVIRAEEHLTNTHRQVLIYRGLDWAPPEFAHVSLILGQDRSKLSKRHGATSVNAFAEEGYLPDAMLNYLTLLGWSPPDGKEIFSRDEAIGQFALDRVNPAPAVFDQQKLAWVNSQYIHGMSGANLRLQLVDEFRRRGWIRDEPSAEVTRWFDEAIDLVKTGSTLLPDIPVALRLFFEFDPALPDPEGRAAVQEGIEVIQALKQELLQNAPRTSEEYHALAERLKAATGAKGKKLFMPVRAAVTGTIHGPELHRTIPLLQKGSELHGVAKILSPLERVEAVLRASWPVC
jgi:nondiscriminating glutamyl-tRNA synthetase